MHKTVPSFVTKYFQPALEPEPGHPPEENEDSIRSGSRPWGRFLRIFQVVLPHYDLFLIIPESILTMDFPHCIKEPKTSPTKPALALPTGQPCFPQKGQTEPIAKSPAKPTNQPENLNTWPTIRVLTGRFLLFEQHGNECCW